MKILVTGASGYIGSHLCKQLKENNFCIVGWDNEIHIETNDVTQYCDEYYKRDVTDKNISGSFDVVVHLAGRSVVSDSMKEPSEYYRVNAIGTLNIINKIQTPHIIFASTASAWGMDSPYARSKVAAEDIIKELANGYTIFRFFNVSGTDGINKQLGPASHLIRIAAEHAAGKRDKIEVYGTDYDTRDGTCIRDYVHILDLTESIINSIKRGPINTPYECIGTNAGISVREILSTMEEVTNVKLNIIDANRRPGDTAISVVDKASNLVNIKRTIKDMCLDQYNLEKRK